MIFTPSHAQECSNLYLGTRIARLARASAMPVEHTWWEAGVRCSLFSGGSIRFGSNPGWPASMRRLTRCSKAAPSARDAVRKHRDFADCAAYAAGAGTMDDSSGPTEAGLGVGRHRELRGLEGVEGASSTLHEQRAIRQPDLFMHSTWSLRDDYHSQHRGSSTGSAVHDMRRAEAARELSEAAMLAPFDDGTRLWRAFELGQPGPAIDCTAALRADAVHRAAVTSSLGHGRRSPRCVALPHYSLLARATLASTQPQPLFCTFSNHVLHGYGERTAWASFTTSPTNALLYALFLHAKAGPTPPAPDAVRAKLDPV